MHMVLFLHVVGMSLFLGGQLFLVAVALPAMRTVEPESRLETFTRIGRVFGMVAVVVLALLIATGVWMMLDRNLSPADNSALRHKLELLSVVLISTTVHGIASVQRKLRVARVASIVTLLSTLGIVWYALAI